MRRVTNLQGAGLSVTGGRWTSLMLIALSIGLFVQVSGKVWFLSGSGRNTQIYIWLLLPALVYVCINLVRRTVEPPPVRYLPWLAFILWVAISVLWSVDSVAGPIALAKRSFFIGLFIVAIYLLINCGERYFLFSFKAALLVVVLGALASLIYQYGVVGKPLAYRGYRIDRMGLGNIANYGWPVAAGIFHGAIATWVLGFALDKRGRIGSTLLWLVAFLVLSLYVLMTGTRGAWVALACSCLFVVAMQRREWLKYTLVVALILSFILAWVLWDKIVLEVVGRQLSGRGQVWEHYFSVMPGHWVFGFGLGTPFEYRWPNGISVSPHAHSLYLQQVYDSGLIALALMAIGLGGVFIRVWSLRDSPVVCLAFPALLFALIAMLTDVERIITRPGDYWTVFWLPVSVILAARRYPRSS